LLPSPDAFLRCLATVSLHTRIPCCVRPAFSRDRCCVLAAHLRAGVVVFTVIAFHANKHCWTKSWRKRVHTKTASSNAHSTMKNDQLETPYHPLHFLRGSPAPYIVSKGHLLS
jgi:hypothetical protein